ncbi:Zn-ribbon domain-containing OB-fold protein [Nocardia carnea]|uniref:Zn-ribbon domain-containing OB-fold protein n=1 Tax=Nocardia carnea TaxID=37328 RepID=A0ABW7TW20_9NOCA|nr:OB-fold domain-containing protein [Nocardia carnea]
MTTPTRPLPVPDARSAPYWAAAARHELAIARCARCDRFEIPPDAICSHCGTADPVFRFERVSGRGVVRSWTVVHRASLAGFARDVPYLLVDVELAEQAGLRMIGRLLDDPDTVLRDGMPVRAAFEDIAPGTAVPAFALAPGGSS